jgi:Bacterial SH3 domain
MPFPFKALGATLIVIVAPAIIGPCRAQPYPPLAAPELVPIARSVSVTAKVNLRSGAGTYSEIIASIPAGSRVWVTSCMGEWCDVTWNGRSGYAIARNLRVGAPQQARPCRPQPGYTESDAAGHSGSYVAEPPVVYREPGYYPPPADPCEPTYYGPEVDYGPGWSWRGWQQ